jgi:hypothetical protein
MLLSSRTTVQDAVYVLGSPPVFTVRLVDGDEHGRIVECVVRDNRDQRSAVHAPQKYPTVSLLDDIHDDVVV